MLKTNLKLGHQNLQSVLSFYHLELTPSKCGLCLTWHNRTHCVTSSCLVCCVDMRVDRLNWRLLHVTDWGKLKHNFGQQQYLVDPASVKKDNYSWQTGYSKVADGLPHTVNSNRYCIPVNVSVATCLHVQVALWNLLARWKIWLVLALRLAFLGPHHSTAQHKVVSERPYSLQ